jgi:hypothetical protein
MLFVLTLSVALVTASAQTSQPAAPPPQTGADAPLPSPAPRKESGDQKPADQKPADTDTADDHGPDRIFGVLPNYTTVTDRAHAAPVDAKQTFVMAAWSSFDPYVFPFVGVVAGIAQVTNQEPSWGGGARAYGRRYATAFGDNTIGNFMTTAVLPTALHQDPRYFVLGSGSFLHRLGYAASRSVVTRSRDGRREFNASEIGGNAIAATLSNTYHPAEDRDASSTAYRMGSQIMWDTLSNEMKEFWPDIRQRLHHH